MLNRHFQLIPPAFGLDISDSSFKYVQLQPKGKYYQPTVFGEGEFPKGLIEGGRIVNPEQVSKIIENALPNHGKISKYAAISLPDESVFLKTLRLPLIETKELESTVMVEAERSLPIQAENSYMHYKVLNNHPKDDHMDVIVGAARKDAVDEYSKTILNANLIPVVIEPEVVAIARSAIKGGQSKKAVIITEIGANRTRLIAFAGNSVVLTGSVNFSTNNAVEAMARALDMDIEKASKLRWDPKLLKDPKYGPKIEKGLSPLYERLADAINNYMGFLQDNLKEQGKKLYDVERIILSGGGSRLPGATKQLSMILQRQVEVVNPWVNVLPYPLKETPELSYENSVRYTTAIGLAIRGSKNEALELYD